MKSDLTVWRTPNLICPACDVKRAHTAGERALFHPLAGHGFNGTRWTHEILDPRTSESARFQWAHAQAAATTGGVR